MEGHQFILSLPAFPRPTVVLTGAPGSGKTTAIRALPQSIPGVAILDEAATAVKHHNRLIGDDFADPATAEAFERAVFAHQLIAEELLAHRLRRPGARIGVLDRGLLNGGGYLPGGIPQLHRLTNVDPAAILLRYTAVLWFAPAPSGIYEVNREVDEQYGHRTESYEDSVRLGELQRDIWKSHPNFVVIDGPDWQTKYRVAVVEIERFASQPLTIQ